MTTQFTAKWEGQLDEKALVHLTITDVAGTQVAAAIWNPATEEFDTDSDGCGILISAGHAAYDAMRRMDENGAWPNPPWVDPGEVIAQEFCA